MSTQPPPDRGDPDTRAVEGEIVTSVPITLPAEGRKHPGACSHGCGCGIHSLIGGNLRLPPREAEKLDHGELAQLFAAARRTTQLLDGHRASLQELGARLERAGARAEKRLSDFRITTSSGSLARATAHLRRMERDTAELPPEVIRGPGVGTYLLALTVFATVLVFDYFFLYEMFIRILEVPILPSLLERAPAIAISIVLPLGLILTGKLIAPSVWRFVAAMRRPPGPDANPWAHRARRALQITVMAAIPVYLIVVILNWAAVRGYVLRDSGYKPDDPPIIALVLLLAVLTVAAEVLISNPYVKNLHQARKEATRQRRRACEQRDLARDAINEHEQAWRALRDSRDVLLSLARTEMGRAWEQMILPARFAHGRAGDVAPEVNTAPPPSLSGVPSQSPGGAAPEQIDLRPADPDGDREQAQEAADGLVFFSSISTPLPGLGPLNETVRRIVDYDPAPLVAQWKRTCAQLEAQEVTS